MNKRRRKKAVTKYLTSSVVKLTSRDKEVIKKRNAQIKAKAIDDGLIYD